MRNVALWVLFSATVAAVNFSLLHACGLSLPRIGLNFCPVAPTTMSDGAERRDELRKAADQLEADLARQKLACVSVPPPQTPPLELPPTTGQPLPQQTAELKPPPDLPADRWDKKDLGMLKGCWVLGHPVPSELRLPNGSVEDCTDLAGTLCFDANGRGRHEVKSTCTRSAAHSCVASVSMHFASDGKLVGTQPQGRCPGVNADWYAESLVCTRVDDKTANCKVKDQGGESDEEFRRAP